VGPTQPYIWGTAKERSARVNRPDAELATHLPLGSVLITYRAISPLPRLSSWRGNIFIYAANILHFTILSVCMVLAFD
jgi:hypothetical protein